MPHPIADHTLLQCDKGSTPSELKVTSQTFMQIENKLQATEKDIQPNVNIQSFGLCNISQKPCIPTPIKWEDTSPFEINGNKELLDCSSCKCSLGGIISIIKNHQNFVEE